MTKPYIQLSVYATES